MSSWCFRCTHCRAARSQPPHTDTTQLRRYARTHTGAQKHKHTQTHIYHNQPIIIKIYTQVWQMHWNCFIMQLNLKHIHSITGDNKAIILSMISDLSVRLHHLPDNNVQVRAVFIVDPRCAAEAWKCIQSRLHSASEAVEWSWWWIRGVLKGGRRSHFLIFAPASTRWIASLLQQRVISKLSQLCFWLSLIGG